ncbi:MAG TPA: dipeptidase PepV [Acholeplasmataceae bacterium]|jgi:succinyl-diaminopimelate desuccinylase|nr:dipeptidase PepV [Acholeplasmataceae bacterium]
MKIDFKNEVLKRKKEFLHDLETIIKINSELTTYDPKRVGAPFGEGNKLVLDAMLNIGKKDGFNVLNVDGFAGHIEYGNQKEFVAILGHLDVVPAGNDWTYPPYELTNVDGKIYGRGVEDDKGPTLAAYYAMKILKELNVPLSKRIKLIVGVDEESGSRCMQHYLKRHPEVPVSGFVPDADFPLIYAEKGITRVDISGYFVDDLILSMDAGLRSNMVPDQVKVVLKGNLVDKIKSENKNLEPKLENGNTILIVSGKSAHGSTPELGVNAVFNFVKLAQKIGLNSNLLQLLDKYFVDDTKGHKLGINITCPETGHLSENLGILKYNGKELVITLDIRYPKGITHLEIRDLINLKVEEYKLSVTKQTNSDMLYVSPDSKLVKTLLNSYIKHSGDKDAKPIVIGGGTYARSIPNVVAFGPHFPGRPSFIHQRDEYVLLDDLLTATIIYLEALYELAK